MIQSVKGMTGKSPGSGGTISKLSDYLSGEVGMMRNRPLLFFTIIHAAIFLGLFVLLSQLFYPAPGDLERDFGLKILSGMMPYRDFTAEYPPLGLLTFTLPAIFFKEHLSYAIALAGEMLLLDIGAMFLLSSLAPRFSTPVHDVLGLYTVFVLAVGPLVVVRYDLLPAVLMLLAVWAFTSSQKNIAWLATGLGVMAKIYPIIVIPVFALYGLRYKKYGQLFQGAVVFAGMVLLIALPWFLVDSNGFISMLTYHTQRGLHWESTYASLVLVGQVMGLVHVQGELTFGSWNLVAPPLSDYLSRASMYVLVVILISLYIKFGRTLWRQAPSEGNEAPLIARYCLLVVLVFLLTSKVFSPQFMIWLYPLLALVSSRHNIWVPALFVAAGAITQVLYPYIYTDLELAEGYAVALLAVRNLMLVAMAVLLVRPAPFPVPKGISHTARANGRRWL